MSIRRRTLVLASALTLALAGTALPGAATADTMREAEIVSKARFTVQNLAESTDWPQAAALFKRARAVMVYPLLLKGALFVGGEGGSGVLVARGPLGDWSYPAFYTMGSLSFGLQIGGQASEAVLFIMTDRALTALMKDQVKLGADISAAAGPVGSGAEASTASDAGAEIYSYSTSKGLFVGASLEGAVLARREDMNQEYYGQSISPGQIVLDRLVSNPDAEPLRAELARLSQQ